MRFTGIANSQQLRTLTDVLDEYCLEHGISDSSEERAEASKRIYMLFENGLRRPAELKRALAVLSRNASRRFD
jgi:hypothetical protein